MTPIHGFFDEYRWLSNFWLVSVTYNDITYPSSEHAYMAAKTEDVEVKKHIASLSSPGKARKYGRHEIKLRPDWNNIRLREMENILRIKFSNPELKEKLLATKDAYLEETNTWHDCWWGVCRCDKCGRVGENHLGKIIMKIRDEMK